MMTVQTSEHRRVPHPPTRIEIILRNFIRQLSPTFVAYFVTSLPAPLATRLFAQNYYLAMEP